MKGGDFYPDPRFTSDGMKIAWAQRAHPDMPWEGTEIWVADASEDDQVTVVAVK